MKNSTNRPMSHSTNIRQHRGPLTLEQFKAICHAHQYDGHIDGCQICFGFGMCGFDWQDADRVPEVRATMQKIVDRINDCVGTT